MQSNIVQYPLIPLFTGQARPLLGKNLPIGEVADTLRDTAAANPENQTTVLVP
jgi:hypothetical protein